MDVKAFIKAINLIVEEKNIDEDVIWQAMELALITAYKKNFDALTNVKVDINKKTGAIKVLALKTVVDKVSDEKTETTLLEAKKINPDIEEGAIIEEEVTPKDFGRVAASTAKQVLTQRIREAERDSIMDEFNNKQDELVLGNVSREDVYNYYIDLGRAHGTLSKKEIIPGEKITMGSSIRVYISKIENTPKGPRITLSRSHYGFVKRLLELEIPELQEGIINLYSVARDAGNRSKIAVYSENENVDPIGACIGEKGERINRVIEELKGEKIDVVLYDKDPAKFIANALNPAKDLSIYIIDPKKKTAIVVAEGDNLSLAIGRKGQNVRLAARLTHYRIDIKNKEQIEEEGINLNTVKEEDDGEEDST